MWLRSACLLLVLTQSHGIARADEKYCGDIAQKLLVSEYHHWSESRTTLEISFPNVIDGAKFSAIRATLGGDDGSTFEVATKLGDGLRTTAFQLPRAHPRLTLSIYYDIKNCFRRLEVEFERGNRIE
jgi:hypothetical protein